MVIVVVGRYFDFVFVKFDLNELFIYICWFFLVIELVGEFEKVYWLIVGNNYFKIEYDFKVKYFVMNWNELICVVYVVVVGLCEFWIEWMMGIFGCGVWLVIDGFGMDILVGVLEGKCACCMVCLFGRCGD